MSAHLSAQRRGRQPDRAKAGHQHVVIAADSDLLQPLIDGAEAAGYLRTIGVGKLVGQGDQVLLFGQQEIGHAAVALPPVGAAIFLARARNHVAATAVVADSAPRDVINNHPVAFAETTAARTGLDDLPGGLVAGDDALVALRTLAEMLVIDTADV